MSGVAALYNVPSTRDELNGWSSIHAIHHRDLNRVIFQKTGLVIPEYVLDPFNINNAESWLYQHQVMHQNQDQILGISGFDLTDVDMKDQNQLAGWIFLNANEHVLAANALGIG